MSIREVEGLPNPTSLLCSSNYNVMDCSEKFNFIGFAGSNRILLLNNTTTP